MKATRYPQRTDVSDCFERKIYDIKINVGFSWQLRNRDNSDEKISYSSRKR